jgi:hypothetical protein
MKRKILYSMMLAILVTLGASKASRACGNFGGPAAPVTCNTYLSSSCDGQCDGDVCEGTESDEYACSDGTIEYVVEHY